MSDSHRLTFSISDDTKIISIVDMTVGTSYRVIDSKVQSNGIDSAIIVEHLKNIQNVICTTTTEKPFRFYKGSSQNCQIIEVSDTEFEISYDKEHAVYKDMVCKCTEGYTQTHVLKLINSLYDFVFKSAEIALNNYSVFKRDLNHDLLICQSNYWQIVGKWANFKDGILSGALINGAPIETVVLLPNVAEHIVEVFDNSSKLLFTLPFDKSAEIVFGIKENNKHVQFTI